MLHAHHFNNAQRGNHVLYRHGMSNNCPGCGRSQWIIGRRTAECCFCATAIELEEPAPSSTPHIMQRGRPGTIHTPNPYSGIIRHGKGNRGLR
jgi:hypothetical protein